MKSKATARKVRASSSKKDGVGVASASLFGICVGLICALALALLCSFICTLSSDPNKLMTPLSTVSLAAVYFSSGFAAAKKRPAAIPCGLLTGGGIAAVFWIISLFFNDSYSSGLSLPVELLIRITFVAVSLVGALIGVNAGTKKRRRRRR